MSYIFHLVPAKSTIRGYLKSHNPYYTKICLNENMIITKRFSIAKYAADDL